MAPASDVSQALATLQARWGTGVLRRGSELGLMVDGALARVPAVEPEPVPDPAVEPAPGHLGPMPFAPAPAPARPGVPVADEGRVVSTGFAALDAILGTGGLPRAATVALRGDASSGKTTAALRTVAEAQAGGAIAAWLDLARAFDPVEAVARGVRPEWLVVLTPADLEEALSLAAALLSGRTVDVLVLDLPDGRDPATAGKRVGDRLGRLAALARRAGTLLVVLEPVALGRGLAAAVEEASGLRLELRRSGWIRLGRDVVGQRSTVEVARNRFGPPGRRADVEILYA
jgi:recombination protein RecA